MNLYTHICFFQTQQERQKKIQEIMREPAEPAKENAETGKAPGQKTKQEKVREVMADTKLTPQVCVCV